MRDSVLFSEQATIHDVVQNQRREVTKFLDELSPEKIMVSSFDDLCAELEQQFRVDVPALDRSRIVELPKEEVDIDVSNDPRRDIRGRSGPLYVKGTAFRIAVPFSGEAVLFQHGISPFNSPISGEIEGDRIVLTHKTLEPNVEAIKRDFDGRINRIEETLRMTAQVTEDWNRQLPGIVRPA